MAESTQTEEARTFTPGEIADACGADPKAVRAFLRSNFSRPAEMKGKSWSIDAETAEQVIEHFTADESAESNENEVLEELED